MKPKCKTCRFWVKYNPDRFFGSCRRHPPNLLFAQKPHAEVSDMWLASQWPVTDGQARCGEWAKK